MNGTELQEAVNAIVQQIVALTHPSRVLLFGSAAKGQWRTDSDLDFLVVVPEHEKPGAILDLLNTRVRRRSLPCDFLVVTAHALRRQQHNPGLVYRQILQEGREVYAR